MSLRSMTGFASVRKNGEPGEIIATVKSVNHRALDLHTHLASELEPFEPALRNLVKKFISRGHIDLRLVFHPAHAAAAAALNRPLFESYLQALREAADSYNVVSEPDANAALRIQGMLSLPEAGVAPPGLEELVLSTVGEALALLNQFREREGAEMGDLLKRHNASIRKDAGEIAGLRTQATEAIRSRLADRLADLLANAGIDPQRLAQEAALLADRSDIAEETARLEVHARELDALLDSGGELGKKLDFLMQEMSRETNTILSKTSGLGDIGLKITALGLEVKANIERIREQVLNLE